MSFDLRPYGLDLQAGDGQTLNSEGVTPDEWENCTFEALRTTLRTYGYRNLPDDEQLREMVDPGSHGGESWGKSQVLAAKLAPDLVTSWEYPADIVAAIRGYGGSGFVVHVGFACDTEAWVPAHGTVVASHAEVLLWGDDLAHTGWKNVWPHPSYSLTHDQVRQLYDGAGILVFKRSLIPAPIPAPVYEEVEMIVIQPGQRLRFPASPATVFGLTAQDADVHGAIFAFDQSGKTNYFSDPLNLAGAKTTGKGPQSTGGTLGQLGMKAAGCFDVEVAATGSGPVVLSLR